MPDSPDPAVPANGMPAFGFSIQNDGHYVAFHVNMPLASHVFAIPVDAADAFADDFAKNMKMLAKQAKQQRSGLVIASETAMNVLKGKQ